ncbi:MAG: DUF2279 domain-containing protein [Saprospiraceae bacterium]|nr:DUF2279 domain-containing protein [Saprospiraceae bacterium]
MRYYFIYIFFLINIKSNAQCFSKEFFIPADSLSIHRVYLSAGFSAAAYSSFSTGLYYAWYRKNELSSFHTFNDWNQWKFMDKAGHMFTTYIQSELIFKGSKWAGLSNQNSMIMALSISNLFQSTIEIMDGFSHQWGFSWSDFGANLMGSAFYATQQIIWNEQKFKLKFSSQKVKYSIDSDELNNRINSLYSERLFERLLKDYNGQTYWISFHPISLWTNKKSFWPDYLNLSIGYGVSGLYGGHSNSWFNEGGKKIQLDPEQFPRINQYYLSFDLNLSKLKVQSPVLKTIFSMINIIKFPAPTIEFNSKGKFKFHPLYF